MQVDAYASFTALPETAVHGLQDQAGTQTIVLTGPGYEEVPASLEDQQQATAELAHASSTADALTEEASFLLETASASSLSLGESIMEVTITDLLQAPLPNLHQTPLQQRSTAQASIQAELADAPTQPSSQQEVLAERRLQGYHHPNLLAEATIYADTAMQATQSGMQAGTQQVCRLLCNRNHGHGCHCSDSSCNKQAMLSHPADCCTFLCA